MRLIGIFSSAIFMATALLADDEQIGRVLEARIRAGAGIEMSDRGRVLSAHALDLELDGEGEAAARCFVRAARPWLFEEDFDPEQLELVEVSESLTGTHFRFRQLLAGKQVLGGEFVVALDRAGRLSSFHNRVARGNAASPRLTDEQAMRVVATRWPERFIERPATRLVPFNHDRVLRYVYEVISFDIPLERFAHHVDAITGEILETVPLFFTGKPARVFSPNPVTTLNNPSLQDNNDLASAVPPVAYRDVELEGLAASGPLSGPHVLIADLESPPTLLADASSSLIFDRSDDRFEEVMAYHHIDRSQRYLQSLGFTGSKRVISTPQRVDAHGASGADNSYYVPQVTGQGALYFGDGGVDDAEDGDIVLHEYGHAMQDAIGRGTFNGSSASQARAMGEGFGDYWSFSSGYETSLTAGRDPFCIGDWDARCGDAPSSGCGYSPGANCLRRVDGAKTMDQYSNLDQRGTEHANGEIWSSALRQVFLALVGRHGIPDGRRKADQIVVEGNFGLPPNPTFKAGALKIIEADRLLNGGAHASDICSAMTLRKILGSSECDSRPRGDYTLFQSGERNIAIPDALSAGIVSSRFIEDSRTIEDIKVVVRIRHPHRGDLRVTLIAPNGTSAVLHAPGSDSGDDIFVTYGLDAEPQEPLSRFRGMPARGEWKLSVADIGPLDVGELVEWSLLIKFAGDAPITQRSSISGERRFILAVANTPGAEGTNFVSDVRMYNDSLTDNDVTVIFTPSGADGTTGFSAIRLRILPGQTVAMDDVVRNYFRATGTGNLEIRSSARLRVSSRTYNNANQATSGTFGQFIEGIEAGLSSTRLDPPLHIPQLQNSTGFRSNIGLSELDGATGSVEIRLFDGAGTQIDLIPVQLLPFSHAQFGILGGIGGRPFDAVRAEVRVASGNGRVGAYGSAVDNRSGDSIYIPGVIARTQSVSAHIPAVLHADGALGTAWRTDLWLTNTTDSSVQASVVLHLSVGASPIRRDVPLPPRASLVFADVLPGLFATSSGTGQLQLTLPVGVLATSRTWNSGETGSYGQFIAARADAEAIAISRTAELIQIESSASYRTNLGLAETSGSTVRVRTDIRDASGNLLCSRTESMAANGQIQFSAAQAGCSLFTNGRALFTVLEGTGAVLPYASVIDNLSGDPIYIPAR